MVAIMVAGMPW